MPTAMITLLIASALVIVLVVVAFYRLQRPQKEVDAIQLTPAPRSLFDAPQHSANMKDDKERLIKERLKLIERAASGDYDSLQDASRIDRSTYDEVLDSLATQHGQGTLLTLASYISRHQLPASRTFANSFINFWRSAPTRVNTAKMLHVVALSDSAGIFAEGVELIMQYWREKKLPDISSLELQALFSGEFWILSSSTRSSGAGYFKTSTKHRSARAWWWLTTSTFNCLQLRRKRNIMENLNLSIVFLGFAVFVALVFVVTLLWCWFCNVGAREIAIKERRYWGVKMPPGRVVATEGEVGIQADVLKPGLHVIKFPFEKVVRKVPLIEIGADELGHHRSRRR